MNDDDDSKMIHDNLRCKCGVENCEYVKAIFFISNCFSLLERAEQCGPCAIVFKSLKNKL